MLRQLSNHWPTVADQYWMPLEELTTFCNSKMKPQDGKGPNLAIMMDEGFKA